MARALQVCWDASALVKRYYDEVGRETVNALFDAVSPAAMIATPWTYAETYAILLRRFNGGILRRESFSEAVSLLQAEVVNDPDFRLLSISDATVFVSLALIQAHNINAVDAALLATYLRYQRSLPSGTTLCLLVSADQRLERAARAEGLPALNPELMAPAALPDFLNVL